jgi:hypothetical protein
MEEYKEKKKAERIYFMQRDVTNQQNVTSKNEMAV